MLEGFSWEKKKGDALIKLWRYTNLNKNSICICVGKWSRLWIHSLNAGEFNVCFFLHIVANDKILGSKKKTGQN